MTLGFVCADVGRSRFLAIEIDERFGEKLPYLAEYLELRGFAAAAIVTNGSDSGRGKILVFVAKPYGARTLHQLVREIYAGARRLGGWSASKHRAPSITALSSAKGDSVSAVAIANHRAAQRAVMSLCPPTGAPGFHRHCSYHSLARERC